MKIKEDQSQLSKTKKILSAEQEEILDLYLKNLDEFLDSAKESEKAQVEIETLHLKKILTK